jgi:DNA-binding SARP family transcriptional activator
MARLYLNLLGGFQARLEPGGPVALPTKKTQALLAYLALSGGQAQPRDKLATLLWGGTPDVSARNSFRQALFMLRKALASREEPLLRIEREAIALNPMRVNVDVAAFEGAVAGGTLEALENAAALYQGDLLEGMVVDEAPFEEWLLAERERLRELALEGLAKLLVHERNAGAIERAIRTALRVSALDPLHESVHRTLMRLYVQSGRRGAALRQYQRCVGLLERELGVEPELETKRLYRSILQRQDVTDVPLPMTAEDGAHRGGAPAIRGRTTRQSPAAETLLIGRGVELIALQRVLKQAEEGRGQVVILIGEAGIGKSALIAALAAEAERRAARVLVGYCHESEKILPFGPWVDAFRTGQVTSDEKVMQALSPVWRAELTRLLPEMDSRGLPVPSDDRLRLFGSVAHLFTSLASMQPVTLVLEDMHWADQMSVRLLSFIGRRLGTLRMLAVVSVREEELADAPGLRRVMQELQREPHVAQLPLAPLSPVDTTTVVRSLAGSRSDEAGVARLADQVWAVSEGNPFTVVETTRALLDGAVPESPDGLPLAERVRQVIAARLERLGPQGRQLLPVAAVIGREFDFALLQRAAGLDEREVAEGVEELVRRRVWHSVGDEFDFLHDRIRAVTYGQLLPPRRTRLHALVAQAMEGLYAENLARYFTPLGMHYKRGEVWDKAVFYLRQAGSQAMVRSAYHEARASIQEAHEIIKGLAESHERREQAIDTLIDLSHCLIPLSDHGRALETLLKAEELTQALDDRRRRARVLSALCSAFWLLGSYAEAVESGERALALGAALNDVGIQVVTNHRLGQVFYSRGDYRRGAEVLARSVDALEGHHLVHDQGLPTGSLTSAFSKIWLAWCLAELGTFPEAICEAEEAVRIAETAGQTYTRLQAYFGLGLVRVRNGDIDSATQVLEHGRVLCRSIDAPLQFHLNAASLGYAYALSGRAADGLPLLNDAVQHVTRTGGLFAQVRLLVWLGEAYLLAGRIDDATTTATEALNLCRARGERGREAYALRLLGKVTVARDPVDVQTADDYYRQGMELARKLGMRPLMADCHLDLGILYKQAGKRDHARSEIAAAIDLYRAMRMASWLRRAEAALADAC